MTPGQSIIREYNDIRRDIIALADKCKG